MELTSEVIAGAAGILLSLIFMYVPGLRTKYAALATELKSAIMLASLVLVSGFIMLSSCMGWWVFTTCDQGGVMKLIETFVIALVANQSIYTLAPDPTDVREAKVRR
jgi:hypothetical protein